jgi:NAD-dependent DNA ligase
MGYPMTYDRVINRNWLQGGYPHDARVVDRAENIRAAIAGDLRRLEADQRDERHLKMYARGAGVTEAQAKKVLDMLFEGHAWYE